MLAMQRAVNGLTIHPEFVLIDGNKCPILTYPCLAMVKGDALVAAISAASILAKVAVMPKCWQLHDKYPHYGFADHKGYPTVKHLAALKKHGPLMEHRRSFKPVREALSHRLSQM
jgi:ribonuclease HII